MVLAGAVAVLHGAVVLFMLTGAVHAAAVQVGTYTVALGLNAVGYGLLLARARRRA
ncbi:hypothetical protein [Geodermatophilus telluris]|uniref:hypothetical protein n=1 Tax=Geodermatophilus telluris TaxID=1190417 RepID=UPI00158724F7|nr:hypothetical protein [Geodermatophilus telluris]